jgi:hypothetical protein
LDDDRQRDAVTFGASRRWGPSGSAGVDGVDDLGVADAVHVDRGNPEVGVPQLALDGDQRDAFPSDLNGVGVTKPVRREPSPHARSGDGVAQVRYERRRNAAS